MSLGDYKAIRQALDEAVTAAAKRIAPATHADLADLDRRLKVIERKIDRLAARGK